ncbi:Protein brambleberry Precursor [Channa argus]|uniref:Protein brambleberry n=1 Tax=Channa argus TaxID=215402 RepID=A0A6G1PJC2_CHAAH|nr:Protein brambleberry Precursor [Channa argus]
MWFGFEPSDRARFTRSIDEAASEFSEPLGGWFLSHIRTAAAGGAFAGDAFRTGFRSVSVHFHGGDLNRTDPASLPMMQVIPLAAPHMGRGVGGLFEWLKTTETAPASALSPPVAAAPKHLAKDAQFEMVSVDDKFLAEAKQMELSPLDSCHYRVVARLKARCESLTEEQLAKLGVVLFNCQAEVEGRQTYPCTEEMTIKDCTADMDSDTWNAYHIVSNRARSVCYATRQQLFRRRAEQTVNSLISTATSQLDAMKDLKEGQLELRELTAASLDKLLEGHSALQAQQGKLYEGQEQMESSLKENLERLSHEKALIASGQELVAELIHGITKRMENVSEHLQIQGSDVQDSHRAIVKDLADVRHQAQDIYLKIGNKNTAPPN